MNKLSALIRELFFRYGYLLSIITLLVITLASLSPRGTAGDPSTVGIPDYFAHIVAYASVILFAVVRPAAPLFWPIITVLAWSCVIELLQPLVGRSGNLHDLGANAIGVFVGWIAGQLLRRFFISASAKR